MKMDLHLTHCRISDLYYLYITLSILAKFGKNLKIHLYYLSNKTNLFLPKITTVTTSNVSRGKKKIRCVCRSENFIFFCWRLSWIFKKKVENLSMIETYSFIKTDILYPLTRCFSCRNCSRV